MRLAGYGLLCASVLAFSTGCAVNKDWVATGGSRSDGVVRLSIDYGPFDDVRASEVQALNLATQRCKSWGYNGAEAFGGATTQCVQRGAYGDCYLNRITKPYQCTGAPK